VLLSEAHAYTVVDYNFMPERTTYSQLSAAFALLTGCVLPD
jgi:hypothetical protein